MRACLRLSVCIAIALVDRRSKAAERSSYYIGHENSAGGDMSRLRGRLGKKMWRVERRDLKGG